MQIPQKLIPLVLVDWYLSWSSSPSSNLLYLGGSVKAKMRLVWTVPPDPIGISGSISIPRLIMNFLESLWYVVGFETASPVGTLAMYQWNTCTVPELSTPFRFDSKKILLTTEPISTSLPVTGLSVPFIRTTVLAALAFSPRFDHVVSCFRVLIGTLIRRLR